MRGLYLCRLDARALDSASEEALVAQVLAGIHLPRRQTSGANEISTTLERILPLLSTLLVQLQQGASQPSEVLPLGILHTHLSAIRVPHLRKNLRLLPYALRLRVVRRAIVTMTFLLSHN